MPYIDHGNSLIVGISHIPMFNAAIKEIVNAAAANR